MIDSKLFKKLKFRDADFSVRKSSFEFWPRKGMSSCRKSLVIFTFLYTVKAPIKMYWAQNWYQVKISANSPNYIGTTDYANIYQPIIIRVLSNWTISDTNDGACDLVQGTILRPTIKKHQNYTHHHLCLKFFFNSSPGSLRSAKCNRQQFGTS